MALTQCVGALRRGWRAIGKFRRRAKSFDGMLDGRPTRSALGPVNTTSTCALQGQKGHARGAKPKAGSLPGEALQRRAWPFWQQPDGNGWHGAPLFVALLAETPGLRCVGRLDWHPMPAVRTRGHSANRPY